MVFLDPDNGLEVKVAPHEPRGPKYAFFDELAPFAERGQSLIVYHHIGRHGSAAHQIRSRFVQIEECLGLTSFALLYHRGSARAFFLIPVDKHRDAIKSKVDNFLDSPWRRHFELVHASVNKTLEVHLTVFKPIGVYRGLRQLCLHS